MTLFIARQRKIPIPLLSRLKGDPLALAFTGLVTFCCGKTYGIPAFMKGIVKGKAFTSLDAKGIVSVIARRPDSAGCIMTKNPTHP